MFKRAGVSTSKETLMPWSELSPYIFASEIAWRKIFDRYDLSLDEILCDDRVAVQFDSIAAQFAPGYTPFEYRWGALKLRKEGMNARTRAKNYRKELKVRKLCDGVSLQELDLDQVPEGPGLMALPSRKNAPSFCMRAKRRSCGVVCVVILRPSSFVAFGNLDPKALAFSTAPFPRLTTIDLPGKASCSSGTGPLGILSICSLRNGRSV